MRDYNVLFLEPIIAPAPLKFLLNKWVAAILQWKVFSHFVDIANVLREMLVTQDSSDLELTAAWGFEDTVKLKPHKAWEFPFSLWMMLYSH